MANVQVDCRLLWNSGDAEAGITHVGGPGAARWLLSHVEILSRLNRDVDSFFILTGERCKDRAVRGEVPHWFIQTRTDNAWPPNAVQPTGVSRRKPTRSAMQAEENAVLRPWIHAVATPVARSKQFDVKRRAD